MFKTDVSYKQAWRHAGLAVLGVVLLAAPVQAARVRRFFEPTDLDLEVPGVLSLDLQAGVSRIGNGYRLDAPDFEIGLGVLPDLEIDLEGTLAFEDSGNRRMRFEQFNPDNIWLGFKFPLIDVQDSDEGYGLGLGMQVGPKLPAAPGAQGLGLEGVFLLGLTSGPNTVALNFGALMDPRDSAAGHRPFGFETGIDWQHFLDSDRQWSLLGQLGGQVLQDQSQLTLSAGVAFDPSEKLELSLNLTGETLGAENRLGILLGVLPRIELW